MRNKSARKITLGYPYTVDLQGNMLNRYPRIIYQGANSYNNEYDNLLKDHTPFLYDPTMLCHKLYGTLV